MTIRVKLRHTGKGFFNNLKGVSGSDLKRAVSLRAAKYTQGQVKQGFTKEANPYGVRWDPKKRPDGRKILRGKTGRLKRDITVTPRLLGFRLHAKAPYASFIQQGTKKMDPRMFFPSESIGLPSKWRKRYGQIAKAEIRSVIKGRPKIRRPIV